MSSNKNGRIRPRNDVYRASKQSEMKRIRNGCKFVIFYVACMLHDAGATPGCRPPIRSGIHSPSA